MVEGSGFQVAAEAATYYQRQAERWMRPFAEALVSATVEPGQAVLDVACGTGFATRTAARVSDGGRVAGADINAGMLAVAREVPFEADPSITWHEASALDLPFAADEFDAVICQQGLQFFPDQVAGLTEMRRVARPGARIGATVWARSAFPLSPYHGEQTAMLRRYCDIQLSPDQQASASQEEAAVRDWFAAAGLEQFKVDLVAVEVDLPPLDRFLDDHIRALPWGAPWFDLDDPTRARATSELSDSLAQWRKAEGGFRVPFRSFLAVGTVAD